MVLLMVLSWQPQINQKRMDELLAAANTVLGMSRFSQGEIATINAMAAADKRFASQKQAIVAGCYYEAGLIGGIHESMSQGRLYGRVFVGAKDGFSCEVLRSIASAGIECFRRRKRSAVSIRYSFCTTTCWMRSST